MSGSKRFTLTTTWLDGCSGCHMSLLDMDQRLIALLDRVEVVYSPLVDAKALPGQVDVGLIEGSVSSEEDLHKAQDFRRHCKLLVGLGDCALNGNVPAMRNPFKLGDVIDRAHRENVTLQPQQPNVGVPALLERVRPVHNVVDVDVFIPGCPPSADAIWQVLKELIEGRRPTPSDLTRFGA